MIPAPGKLSPASQRVIAGLLLLVGVQFSLIAGHAMWPPSSRLLIVIVIVAGIALIPPVARVFAAILDRVRNPSARARYITACIIAVVAMLVLHFEAVAQRRFLIPKYQDEFSYLLQARMLAHGKLWTAALPLPDFFESFQILTTPVYGSIYFPGAAICFAPAVWFGLPFWVMPLIASGIAAGLIYRIVAELIDGAAGILAAIMLISLPIFRLTSMMTLAQAPMLMLALASVAAFLRWRRGKSLRWAIVIGIFCGWCAITRPIDAFCFALPIGLAMLIESKRHLIPVFCGAIPFLVLQLIFNVGVTGKLTQSPFGYFSAQTYPQTEYGFHGFDPAIRPTSTLAQKQHFYDEHVIPFLRVHTPAKKIEQWWTSYLSTTLLNSTPHALLLILMPIGLLGLATRARWVVFAAFPLFIALYFPYVFFLTHYTLVAATALILLVLLGAQAVENSFVRFRPQIAMILVSAIAILSVSTFHIFDRTAADDFFGMATDPTFQTINNTLANLDHTPAIVLFHFGKDSTAHIEPVYNIDVVNPDDAKVIRAHDLGERNIELLRYYAKTQPDRAVYLFDRDSGTIRYLGLVREIAVQAPPLNEGESL